MKKIALIVILIEMIFAYEGGPVTGRGGGEVNH